MRSDEFFDLAFDLPQLPEFVCLIDFIRGGRENRGKKSDTDGGGHNQISNGPALLIVDAVRSRLEERREREGAGSGPNHSDSISGLISRCKRSLQIGIRAFNTVGVQRNILCRRRKGGQKRKERQQRQMEARVGKSHAREREHQHELREDQPRAPLSQFRGEVGNFEIIDEGRPQPFASVDQSDPGHEADGFKVDSRLAQPESKSTEDKQQRKSCGESEEKHSQTYRLQINAERAEPILKF